MKLEISKQDLLSYYEKAKTHYTECIKNNDYIENEIIIGLKDIVIINSNVKYVFIKDSAEILNIEIELLLSDGEKVIGKYMYIEDSTGNSLDDSLVIY